MLFFSFFKTLVGQEVSVELKNGVIMQGVMVSVDQYLNIKLQNIQVQDIEEHPQLFSLRNCFIRGSGIR
jgi:U6 snRNA-associated Sm-like protein LSm2